MTIILFPIKALVFYLLLFPLINRNYRLRHKSAIICDGKYPDEWYWADSIAIEYGMSCFYPMKWPYEYFKMK